MGDLGSLSAAALMSRVDAEPVRVLDEVLRRRALGVDPSEAVHLRWAAGLSRIAMGEFDMARTELERATADALDLSDDNLAGRIRVNLSFVLGRLGALDEALIVLDDSESTLSGADLARLRKQRGLVMYWRGDFTEAARVLKSACAALRRFGDQLGELQARVNLGAVLGQIREYGGAERHLREAVELGNRLERPLLTATAHHNLGYLAMLRGDLPASMREFERAERGFVAVGADAYLPRLNADHAQVLADAGLFDDGDALLRRALDAFTEQGNDIEIAGGLVTVAEIRLAQGNVTAAHEAAEEAASWYRKQQREPWVAAAVQLKLVAAARAGEVNADLATALDGVGDELSGVGLTAEATRARLYAAKVRGDASLTDGIDPVPAEVRRSATRGRPSDQILLAHIDALVAGERRDALGARRAITRGLRAAMSAQAALGSIETRAHAAVHGYALTEIGARLAVTDGRPRELLERIEATRMMSTRLPALRPPADPTMAAMLTELRGVHATIADPTSTDEQRADAERARSRVERDVRRRSRTVGGDAASVGVRDELGAALAMLGDRHLLAHAALDGRLYAVSVVKRRARLHDLGEIEGVTEMLDEVAFSLNRLNRVQGSEASRQAAAEMLFEVGAELSEFLLPPIVADGDEPVVVVPTAVLHDVPWGLLPPLGGRAVSVNPSVSAWARAERTRQERANERGGLRTIGFMAGPGLDFAEFEVENLAKLYIDPEVFVRDTATSEACVSLLSRADIVHIACHGSFRTDNPMFSSLHLADGPVIVHDLERLHRLPETVILPACSVGTTKALQGGSLLGLASALTTLGACNVIAPLTPINDAASVTVMDRLHHELIAGASPAAALAVAALEHDLTDPTAGAFITLGA